MTPHSLKHFQYTSCLEDLILLSVAQCPAVLLAYALGLGHRQQRCFALSFLQAEEDFHGSASAVDAFHHEHAAESMQLLWTILL